MFSHWKTSWNWMMFLFLCKRFYWQRILFFYAFNIPYFVIVILFAYWDYLVQNYQDDRNDHHWQVYRHKQVLCGKFVTKILRFGKIWNCVVGDLWLSTQHRQSQVETSWREALIEKFLKQAQMPLLNLSGSQRGHGCIPEVEVGLNKQLELNVAASISQLCQS